MDQLECHKFEENNMPKLSMWYVPEEVEQGVDETLQLFKRKWNQFENHLLVSKSVPDIEIDSNIFERNKVGWILGKNWAEASVTSREANVYSVHF